MHREGLTRSDEPSPLIPITRSTGMPISAAVCPSPRFDADKKPLGSVSGEGAEDAPVPEIRIFAIRLLTRSEKTRINADMLRQPS
jgi:hypothetical protein